MSCSPAMMQAGASRRTGRVGLLIQGSQGPVRLWVSKPSHAYGSARLRTARGRPAWAIKGSSPSKEHNSQPGSQQSNRQAMPEGWVHFLQAVLKKNYGVGYLLLSVASRSTLVLAHLMHALGLGPVPASASQKGTPTAKQSAHAAQSAPPMPQQQEETSGPEGSLLQMPEPLSGADVIPASGSPSITAGATPAPADQPVRDSVGREIVGSLLLEMGMGKDEVSEIMASTAHVPTDQGFLQLLRMAASTNALQGEPELGPNSGSPQPPQERRPPASQQQAADAVADVSSPDTVPPHSQGNQGAQEKQGVVLPQSEADPDNIPMYSRVTDDFVLSTASGIGLLSTWGADVFGGLFGGSGGSNNGAGGGGQSAGGHDGMGPWHPFSAHLQTWLPMALALSIAIPPSALFQLVQQAYGLLSGHVQQGPAAAHDRIKVGIHLAAQGIKLPAGSGSTPGVSQATHFSQPPVPGDPYTMHLRDTTLAWANTSQAPSASFPALGSTQVQADSGAPASPLLDALVTLSRLGTSPAEVAAAITALEHRCAQAESEAASLAVKQVVSTVFSKVVQEAGDGQSEAQASTISGVTSSAGVASTGLPEAQLTDRTAASADEAHTRSPISAVNEHLAATVDDLLGLLQQSSVDYQQQKTSHAADIAHRDIVHQAKEAELMRVQAAVQTLQQENDILRASSAQAIDMLQLETEALRKALQASEAEVERSHAQRVAEVAVTKAALCAQVQEMQEQLSALTSGFEHLSLEQLDAFSIQRSPHGRLTSTPARRYLPAVAEQQFGDGTVHISISPASARRPAEAQSQHPRVPKLDLVPTTRQARHGKPQSLSSISTQLVAMQQHVLALQDELTAGHESLAAAQKVPTAFNLDDFTGQAPGSPPPSDVESRRGSGFTHMPNMDVLFALAATGSGNSGGSLVTPRQRKLVTPLGHGRSPLGLGAHQPAVTTTPMTAGRRRVLGAHVASGSPMLSPSRPALERLAQLQRQLEALQQQVQKDQEALSAVMSDGSPASDGVNVGPERSMADVVADQLESHLQALGYDGSQGAAHGSSAVSAASVDYQEAAQQEGLKPRLQLPEPSTEQQMQATPAMEESSTPQRPTRATCPSLGGASTAEPAVVIGHQPVAVSAVADLSALLPDAAAAAGVSSAFGDLEFAADLAAAEQLLGAVSHARPTCEKAAISEVPPAPAAQHTDEYHQSPQPTISKARGFASYPLALSLDATASPMHPAQNAAQQSVLVASPTAPAPISPDLAGSDGVPLRETLSNEVPAPAIGQGSTGYSTAPGAPGHLTEGGSLPPASMRTTVDSAADGEGQYNAVDVRLSDNPGSFQIFHNPVARLPKATTSSGGAAEPTHLPFAAAAEEPPAATGVARYLGPAGADDAQRQLPAVTPAVTSGSGIGQQARVDCDTGMRDSVDIAPPAVVESPRISEARVSPFLSSAKRNRLRTSLLRASAASDTAVRDSTEEWVASHAAAAYVLAVQASGPDQLATGSDEVHEADQTTKRVGSGRVLPSEEGSGGKMPPLPERAMSLDVIPGGLPKSSSLSKLASTRGPEASSLPALPGKTSAFAAVQQQVGNHASTDMTASGLPPPRPALQRAPSTAAAAAAAVASRAMRSQTGASERSYKVDSRRMGCMGGLGRRTSRASGSRRSSVAGDDSEDDGWEARSEHRTVAGDDGDRASVISGWSGVPSEISRTKSLGQRISRKLSKLFGSSKDQQQHQVEQRASSVAGSVMAAVPPTFQAAAQ